MNPRESGKQGFGLDSLPEQQRVGLGIKGNRAGRLLDEKPWETVLPPGRDTRGDCLAKPGPGMLEGNRRGVECHGSAGLSGER